LKLSNTFKAHEAADARMLDYLQNLV